MTSTVPTNDVRSAYAVVGALPGRSLDTTPMRGKRAHTWLRGGFERQVAPG